MNTEELLERPNHFRIFMMATRTLHWVAITIQNRGVSLGVVAKLRETEEILTAQASKSSLYDGMHHGVEAMIDTYYINEPEPSGEDPQHLWAANQGKKEVYLTLSACIEAIKGAAKGLQNLLENPLALEKIEEGFELFTQWFLSLDVEGNDELRRAIEGLPSLELDGDSPT